MLQKVFKRMKEDFGFILRFIKRNQDMFENIPMYLKVI